MSNTVEDLEAPDLAAEARAMLERLEAARQAIWSAYADYDTPAGAALPVEASRRLARLQRIAGRAIWRCARRDDNYILPF